MKHSKGKYCFYETYLPMLYVLVTGKECKMCFLISGPGKSVANPM